MWRVSLVYLNQILKVCVRYCDHFASIVFIFWHFNLFFFISFFANHYTNYNWQKWYQVVLSIFICVNNFGFKMAARPIMLSERLKFQNISQKPCVMELLHNRNIPYIIVNKSIFFVNQNSKMVTTSWQSFTMGLLEKSL